MFVKRLKNSIILKLGIRILNISITKIESSTKDGFWYSRGDCSQKKTARGTPSSHQQKKLPQLFTDCCTSSKLLIILSRLLKHFRMNNRLNYRVELLRRIQVEAGKFPQRDSNKNQVKKDQHHWHRTERTFLERPRPGCRFAPPLLYASLRTTHPPNLE